MMLSFLTREEIGQCTMGLLLPPAGGGGASTLGARPRLHICDGRDWKSHSNDATKGLDAARPPVAVNCASDLHIVARRGAWPGRDGPRRVSLARLQQVTGATGPICAGEALARLHICDGRNSEGHSSVTTRGLDTAGPPVDDCLASYLPFTIRNGAWPESDCRPGVCKCTKAFDHGSVARPSNRTCIKFAITRRVEV